MRPRVLIIDDEPAMAKVAALQLAPHAVVTIFDGDRETLVDLEDDTPWRNVDVALVDFKMAPVDGCEIIFYLFDHHPHIRRVLVTAAEFEMMRTPGLEQRCDRILFKPYSLHTLVDAVIG